MEDRKKLSKPPAACAGGLSRLPFKRRHRAVVLLLISLGWAGTAGAATITLAWDPSPAPDTAGYTLRFGTNSGNYTDFLVVGTNTSATTPSLRSGATYFFVVSAYTSAGLESVPSAELRYTLAGGVAPNLPPTLDPIIQQVLPSNAGTQTILLSGIGAGSLTETQSLAVVATSSNPALIPPPTVSYLSPAKTATLTFTPLPGVSGTATITVTVNDGQLANNTFSRTFEVMIGTPGATTFYMEAEEGTIDLPMQVLSASAASKGLFVASSADSSGTLTLSLRIPQAGAYGIWCRVLSIDAGTDSFFVSMDGGTEDIFRSGIGGFSTDWQWVQLNGVTAGNPRLFTLSAGTHSLTFRGREADTRLDAIYVTSDRSFVPVRMQLAQVTGVGGGMQLSFQSPPGFAFNVETSEDLRAWTTLWQTQSDLQNQWLRFVDNSVTPSQRRFYRLVTR